MDDLLPDLCDLYPNEVTWLPIQWQSYGESAVFYGEVATVRCFHDNSYVKQLLNSPGHGRVLVVDGGGAIQWALLGDQIAASAVKNGWKGVIVFGAVRDVGAINKMKIGVKALATCPIKTEKRGRGESGVEVHIKKIDIAPGYMVYADKNGVAVSRKALDLSTLGT
ncbi:putative 4-hydroxy-4-methyl-2-oxoglutarate aldolase [Thaumasiovibrio sp. DFM-14]|uniref:putative 4-hydroxy-4-methyl-2-oxoglutarate aldolase n=1 Tax=Thaumasiovibrio sp. DFM-14 TaxID=3384792 RepID=UPI0039A1832C